MAGPVNVEDLRHDELVAATARQRGLPAGTTRAAVVPFQSKPVLPQPQARRRAFEARLDAILAESFAMPLPDGSPEEHDRANEADEGALLDAGCAACRGHCCTQGGDSHAFLGPEDIQRLRCRRPGLTMADARAAYLDLLPETSVLGACLFQSAQGCTLPRALRSDLCNEFRCRGLKRLAALAAEGPGQIAVVAEFNGKAATVTAVGPAQRPVSR